MIARVRRKIDHFLRDRWLGRSFANGLQLVHALRGGPRVHRVELHDGTSIIHPPERGGLMEALIEVWYERSYLPKGFYQPRAGDVIVDIGANIGLFSLQMLQGNHACRLVAVEPFAENFACLKQNFSFYPAERAKALQIAVGLSAGRGTMMSVGDRSLDHVLKAQPNNNADTVPIVTLDQLLDEHVNSQVVALLKMDIEGSERDVFESASDAALARCHRMAVEYHDHIREGSLALIQRRLTPTHDVQVHESQCPGCGLIIARRRAS